jgi:hypothetical protein
MSRSARLFIERHPEIVREPQHLGLALVQADQQVLRLGPLRLPPVCLDVEPGVLLVAELDDLPVWGVKLAQRLLRQPLALGGLGLLDGVLGVQQKAAHAQRPRLPLLLRGDQLAQMMGAAQRVQRIFEAAIRSPVVVYRHRGNSPSTPAAIIASTPRLAMRGQ